MINYALRQLVKNRGFTMVALATLALGIGVNTTAFSVLNRLLLQSLPYHDAGRMVQIWATSARSEYVSQAPGDYFDERDGNTVFENVAAYYTSSLSSLAELGQPAVRCTVIPVTANFFALLRIDAALGRTFTTDEENKFEPLAIVSDAFWRQHYGADPKILGRTIRLDSKVRTIVGVMPPTLDDPMLFGGSPGFWLLDGTGVNRNLRDKAWYQVAARLKPGVTLQQAQAEMSILALRMARDNPKTNTGRGLKVIPFPTNSIGETGAQLTWLIMALSGMVLLIACVNLANLQLVRTTRRRHEIGIRLALGCPRSRLIWMLLTESLILSIAGGALGLMVAKWSNSYIESFFSFEMPLNVRVIAFTFGASLVTGAVFGTVPAWIASRTDVNSALTRTARGSSSDRSRHWLRQSLVVVELSMALVLLAGAGFFVQGIHRLTHRDLGWRTENVIVGFFGLDHDRYGEDRDVRSLVFGDQLREELQALPGVEAVALSHNSPVWGFRPEPFRIEGQPVPPPGKETYASSESTTPGFFKTYGLHVIQGTEFRESDRPGAPSVAIINETMARKFWPGENPIGKRVGRIDPTNPEWSEIIGVVNDFHGADEFYSDGEKYMILRPWAQNTYRFMSFGIRSSVAPQTLIESIRKVMGRLQPDLALTTVSTAQEMMASELAAFALVRRLLLQISVLGLLLAAVGIYGVIANLASERIKEIGIRMALGAEPRAIIWLFLRNGVQLAVIGAAIGLLAAFGLLHVLHKMLPYIPGNDPWLVAWVALLLIGIAFLACWVPALRATRVDPTVALRAE